MYLSLQEKQAHPVDVVIFAISFMEYARLEIRKMVTLFYHGLILPCKLPGQNRASKPGVA